MKTFTYLFVLVIILITIHGKLEAQNQSILLPFSGDTYPTVHQRNGEVYPCQQGQTIFHLPDAECAPRAAGAAARL